MMGSVSEGRTKQERERGTGKPCVSIQNVGWWRQEPEQWLGSRQGREQPTLPSSEAKPWGGGYQLS